MTSRPVAVRSKRLIGPLDSKSLSYAAQQKTHFESNDRSRSRVIVVNVNLFRNDRFGLAWVTHPWCFMRPWRHQYRLQGILVPAGRCVHGFVLMLPGCGFGYLLVGS